MDWNRIEDLQQHGHAKDRVRSKFGDWLARREQRQVMRHLVAVALLTTAQFTAFPFVAMMAANSARHAEEVVQPRDNVTIVYKTQDGRGLATM